MEHAMVDLVVEDLESRFGEVVDHSTLRAVVEARAHRFDEAPIQDFVPLLVEREVRESLVRIAG
jgi:uncharacterized membrane protein YheB (UPF0754 family)